MAISTVREKNALKLELDAGITNGKQKIKSKVFNNVKLDATDDAMHEAAVTLSGLQSSGLLFVKRIEETLIKED